MLWILAFLTVCTTSGEHLESSITLSKLHWASEPDDPNSSSLYHFSSILSKISITSNPLSDTEIL